MIKEYIIRKSSCGHWCIFKCTPNDVFLSFSMVAHLETFSDVLIVLNVNGKDYITNGY